MSKVRCLFGHHDLYYDKDGRVCRCAKCTLSFITYPGDEYLDEFVDGNGPNFSLHPYFYNTYNGAGNVLASSIPLAKEEVHTLYRWTKQPR